MKKSLAVAVTLILLMNLAGCGVRVSDTDENYAPDGQGRAEGTGDLESVQDSEKTDALADSVVTVQADSKIRELEKGLSAVRQEGEDWFHAFLSGGGAKTDGEVVRFLAGSFFAGNQSTIAMDTQAFGCSTLSVQNTEGGYFLAGILTGMSVMPLSLHLIRRTVMPLFPR